MDFRISISKTETYVDIRVYKDITVELVKRFTQEAIALGKEHDIQKLLLDERGCASLTSTTEKYEWAYDGAMDFGLERKWKIALLLDPENKDTQFLETTMRNAGYSFRIFEEEDKAIDWLEGKEKL